MIDGSKNRNSLRIYKIKLNWPLNETNFYTYLRLLVTVERVVGCCQFIAVESTCSQNCGSCCRRSNAFLEALWWDSFLL